MSKTRSAFTTVRSEGGLLPPDLLSKVAAGQVDGLDAQHDYHLAPNERLNEAVSRSWNRLQAVWVSFQDALRKLPDTAPATTETRERWLLIVCQELGFGRLQPSRSLEVGGRSYPISHLWESVPIHLVGAGVSLDHRTRGQIGAARTSPHGLVQELLNASEDYLWGIVSNGLVLRILRDNVAMTRQAFLEFDLEEMMDGQVYSDFALLWLVVHESRFEGKPADCWLERWSKEAQQAGVRALDHLREGVEQAISLLGRGFLSHPANGGLRDRLRSGELDAQEYYRQVLRMAYRFIFLFVGEDRELLLLTDADAKAKETYRRFYSMDRLRHLADQRRGATLHGDLWEGLRVVMEALGSEDGCRTLGLPALGSFLWSDSAINAFVGCKLANRDLLRTVSSLAFVTDGKVRRQIDYRNLGPEELGSVYESLLERHPRIDLEAGSFDLATVSGNERKTTGSYYTPTSLISSLLDTALEPVLDEAARQRDSPQAILSLRVVDPACGSGHFLIAAAHRIARRLAAVRLGDEEPSPEEVRHALRDVIGRCVYGVDVNPMAVELCKVSLWIEALDPGRPLSFLDQHIQCGHSLIGATPELIAAGIPDEAFKPIEGDEREYAASLRKRNHAERSGQSAFLFEESAVRGLAVPVANALSELDRITDDSLAKLHEKERRYAELVSSPEMTRARAAADAWCAALVAPKRVGEPAITEEVLRRLAGGQPVPTSASERIGLLVNEFRFFHWPLAFAQVFAEKGGFDVVAGNPPWERVKLQEQEFFAARDPDIAAASGVRRKRMIMELSDKNPALETEFRIALRRSEAVSHFLRNSGRYPLAGRGDINTYSVFAECMWSVLQSSGRLGAVLPTGLVTDDTNKVLFAEFVKKGAIASVYGFENEEFVFPGVHHATKFCLVTATGTDRPVASADFMFFARKVADLLDQDRHFLLTRADFERLNPNTLTCPIFRNRTDADIARRIYELIPVLIKHGTDANDYWGVRFQRMFDLTNDSDKFRSSEELEAQGYVLTGNVYRHDRGAYLPLYESKMIHIYDHRFGSYSGQTEAQASQGKLPELSDTEHADRDQVVLPANWVSEREVTAKLSDTQKGYLLAFRNVTSAGSRRTFIPAVLPIVAVGNSAPILHSKAPSPEHEACLVACLSSYSFDFITRLKAGGNNMNFFIVEQLPVPPPEAFDGVSPGDTGQTLRAAISRRVLELVYTSWDVQAFARFLGFDGPPFVWDREHRLRLMSELDAIFFWLYGFSRSEVTYVMDRFPLVAERDIEIYGDYRTKRLVLERYDAMLKAAEGHATYQTLISPPPGDPSLTHPAARLK